ncbi:hypothetical protein WJX72_005434 [[Myrmecia] bisecta]|uniref:Zinc finger CCHC domain-containing protein 10 n=1 Tax=[Myrmecia] bisecta TaxID=41462 RepID=A0AAW1QF52_9CHLO
MSLLGSGSTHMQGRWAKRPAPVRAAAANVVCQRCLQKGHWTYECKNEAAYAARPTRTQQLLNPKVRQRFLDPSEAPPEEPRAQRNGVLDRKRKHEPAPSSSSSDSGSSSSSSDSGSTTSTSSSSGTSRSGSSGSSSGSESSSSGSESSSSGSESSSSSSSDSDSSSSSSDTSDSSDSSGSSGASSLSGQPKAKPIKGKERAAFGSGSARDSKKPAKDREPSPLWGGHSAPARPKPKIRSVVLRLDKPDKQPRRPAEARPELKGSEDARRNDHDRSHAGRRGKESEDAPAQQHPAKGRARSPLRGSISSLTSSDT